MRVGTILAAGAAAVGLLVALAALRNARARLRAAERERDALSDKTDGVTTELSEARRARETERSWNRRLREELRDLREEKALVDAKGDVKELVLRTALSLLDAEKGLLLSRKDDDHDGDLDLVCSLGFAHDPDGSAVAQHFATQVIERDRTVRAQDTDELGLDDRTPADEEIECLVAIPIYLRDDFAGVVVCANKPGGFHEYDEHVLLSIGDHAGVALHNERLRGRLRRNYLTTVKVLADAVEAKDGDLGGHSADVSAYVLAVADRLGIDAEARERLIVASVLHDIGKIAISELILLKPGPLSPAERTIVEQHPRIGAQLVRQVPELEGVAPAVLHHHERWDGEGYPSRLAGDDIPVDARLIAVADAFSAMLSDRPYRSALPLEDACEELRRCAGTQFDPRIVKLFVEEVSARPPQGGRTDALTEALADPDISVRLEEGERLLGTAAVTSLDALPILFSHRHLHDSAAAEAARAEVQGKPFGVIVARLPELARLNAERGYAAGDAALRSVAEGAVRLAARCGGIAARESGARIAVLIPSAPEYVLDQLAEELAARDVATSLEIRTAVWTRGDSGDDVIARARGETAPVLST